MLKLAAAVGVEVVERLLGEPGRKESKWRAVELERVLQPRAEAVLELGAKWLGYRLGYQERLLPLWLKRHVSLQPGFWRDGR